LPCPAFPAGHFLSRHARRFPQDMFFGKDARRAEIRRQGMTSSGDFNVFFVGDQIAAIVGLLAVTMSIHGWGMVTTMLTAHALDDWLQRRRLHRYGIVTLIIASLMIVTVHYLEVGVWALFFNLTGALPNAEDAFHFSLMEYVTVGSSINLPYRWRSLEGAIAMSGLLTFAWSTSVLIALVSRFQQDTIARRRRPGGTQ
jgi:hypothetical protein